MQATLTKEELTQHLDKAVMQMTAAYNYSKLEFPDYHEISLLMIEVNKHVGWATTEAMRRSIEEEV